jgi:hypothetical protein
MALLKVSTGLLTGIIVAAVVLTVATAGVLSMNQAIPFQGNVTAVNVAVYSDSQYTQNLTAINWGTLQPGNVETKIIYIKNTGTETVTLNMETANWQPTAAQTHITLTWNKENTTLEPNQQTPATLTLTISESISDISSFNGDLIISGTAEN